MASQDGRALSDLKSELLNNSREFSFFQAIRLLRLMCNSPEKESESGETDNIRIRPNLSLSFPPADIDIIEELDDEDPIFRITANFLGLYGTSSPLPIFYTEELIEEYRDNESVSRDFTDTINHRLFLLFFKCQTKYNLFQQTVEEQNPHYLERLFCLLGLGDKTFRREIQNPYKLLRYAGLFTQSPRSALGLKTLLKDALGGVEVEIVPCVKRKAKIPEHQRFVMGGDVGSLGIDTLVGEEIEDRMGKFRISIGPLDKDDFQKFLPGTEYYEQLVFLTDLYILEPLEYDLEIILAKNQAATPCLGVPEWSRIGMTTWVFSGNELEEQRVRFYPAL
ncbi:MAG: type VI secretion system baseplate subunit TssG [Desulfobacterales bacterium]|nr:type VI secretion system baseplate subunit TssG [Desulfobacterales bacterium]